MVDLLEEELIDLKYMEGLFVGQLDEHETKLFEKVCELGLAYWSYDHNTGFLGIAKVAYREELKNALL